MCDGIGLYLASRFGERFAGKRAVLSQAVAMVGGIDAQEPFDWYFNHDLFSDDGRRLLNDLMPDPLLAAERWAPDCKLFSRARGRPIDLPDGMADVSQDSLCGMPETLWGSKNYFIWNGIAQGTKGCWTTRSPTIRMATCSTQQRRRQNIRGISA